MFSRDDASANPIYFVLNGMTTPIGTPPPPQHVTGVDEGRYRSAPTVVEALNQPDYGDDARVDTPAADSNASQTTGDKESAEEAPAPALAPAPVSSSVSRRTWMTRGLMEHGVFSALPSGQADGMPVADRIKRLQGAHDDARWWLHKLKNTLFSCSDSYVTRRDVTVYRRGGPPSSYEGRWFPGADSYGVDADAFEAATVLGMSVEVTEFTPTTPKAPPNMTEVVQTIDTLLTAASVGAAPPVLAAFLVHDATGLLRGTVVVSSVHTFTLGDMISTYQSMSAADNRLLASQQLHDASKSIVRLLAVLAQARILKLNLSAETIVFVPSMQARDKEWVLCGHGFKVGTRDLVSGMPHVTDFDPRLTRHVGVDHRYDDRPALVFMASVLLQALRAAYGMSTTDVVLNAFLGRDMDGVAGSVPASPLVTAWHARPFGMHSAPNDAFYLMMKKELLGSHDYPQRDPLPKALYEQTLADFTLLSTTETAEAGFMTVYANDKHMVFDRLVMHSTQSSLVLLDAEDERAALDAAVHGTARLRSVINTRSTRRAARRARMTPGAQPVYPNP